MEAKLSEDIRIQEEEHKEEMVRFYFLLLRLFLI